MFERTSGLDDSNLKALTVPPANIELSEIIHPQGLYVDFGGDSHTAFFFDSYNLRQEVYRAVKNELVNRDLILVKNDVWQTVSNERSIRVKYGSNATVNGTFNVELDRNYPMDEILIPLLGRDFVLIKSDGDIYKFSAFLDSKLERLVSNLERTEYTEFKTIEKRFSVLSIMEEAGIQAEKNLTSIPILMDQYLPFYKTEKKVDSLNSEVVESYVKKIFGDDPSFIKSMVTYDETQIFVSNYGKRSISFESNGNVEYINNRTVEPDSIEEVSYEESIKIAWAFAEYMEDDITGLYMMSAVREDNRIKVYMGSEINDHMLYYLGSDIGEAIEIHLIGEEVVYYQSNRRVGFEEIDISHLWTNGLTFSKIFDKNFNTMLKNFEANSNRQIASDTRTYVFEILNSISSYDFEYFMDVDKRSNSIIPAWRIQIVDTIYHIDIYDGVLLGIEKGPDYGLE
jgi:hypothetical protein